MCANFQSPSAMQLEKFGFGQPDFDYGGQCFPAQVAPFLANDDNAWHEGVFGLLPHWAKPDLARRTYNARSETVATLPSFRFAWKHRQLAVIPVVAIYEPCYESGRAVRWRIERKDAQIFGVAGIWEQRRRDDGLEQRSFSMLTINADDHPLMRRFHQPAKEKRSVVILADADWKTWLSAQNENECRSLLRLVDPGLLNSVADPLAKR